MPVYPGDPPVEFLPEATLEADGIRVSRVTFGSHAGTHLDAPSHFLPCSDGVDSLVLERLIGPAKVVDLADLRSGMLIEPNARLLVRSGWSSRWNQSDYFDAFPPLPDWFVEQLAAESVALLGLETPCLHPDHTKDAAFHTRLLSAGVVIVENLTGLEALPTRFDLAVLPLPLFGLDGSPCRAIAWHQSAVESRDRGVGAII